MRRLLYSGYPDELLDHLMKTGQEATINGTLTPEGWNLEVRTNENDQETVWEVPWNWRYRDPLGHNAMSKIRFKRQGGDTGAWEDLSHGTQLLVVILCWLGAVTILALVIAVAFGLDISLG